MKTRKHSGIKLSILAFFCWSYGASALADDISLWGQCHPPLNGHPDDERPGFMIDIAKAVFAKHGHTVRYVLGPRTRGVKMVMNGEIDCVINAKIKEHNQLIFPTEPWGYHAATLFSLPTSSFKFKDLSQLQSVRLGAISGMKYDNGELDNYIESNDPNIAFSHGDDAMKRQVKMLLKGRIDTVVSCPLLMRGQLKALNLDGDVVKISGEVKPMVGMYLACGRGNPRTAKYIELINQTIPLMRESGELQKILDKYGQIDWLDIYQGLDVPH